MNGEHGEHDLEARSVGHVHGINPEVTVSADIVQCVCGASPLAIGVAIGWQEEDGQHFSTALLEPARALRIANAILTAVDEVINSDQTDQMVAGLIEGVDMDAELAKLLGGAE